MYRGVPALENLLACLHRALRPDFEDERTWSASFCHCHKAVEEREVLFLFHVTNTSDEENAGTLRLRGGVEQGSLRVSSIFQ